MGLYAYYYYQHVMFPKNIFLRILFSFISLVLCFSLDSLLNQCSSIEKSQSHWSWVPELGPKQMIKSEIERAVRNVQIRLSFTDP